MSDLQSAHRSALKLILALQAGLERVDALDARGGAPPPPELLADLDAKLDQLRRAAAALDSQWRMASLRDPGNARRDVWARKTAQVSEELTSLSAALGRAKQRAARADAEASHREELLNFRGRAGGAGPGGLSLLDPTAEIAASRSVARSKRILEEAYETGVATLSAMAGQRDVLKSAHRKALDILTSLGLSDSLLRVIEKRARLDKIIAYGGMALTVLIVVLLYWWLKT